MLGADTWGRLAQALTFGIPLDWTYANGIGYVVTDPRNWEMKRLSRGDTTLTGSPGLRTRHNYLIIATDPAYNYIIIHVRVKKKIIQLRPHLDSFCSFETLLVLHSTLSTLLHCEEKCSDLHVGKRAEVENHTDESERPGWSERASP